MSTHHPPPSPNPPSNPTSKAMMTNSGREYMNVSIVNGHIDTSSLPLAPGSGFQYQHEYVNLPLTPGTLDSGTGMGPGKEKEQSIGNGAVIRGKLERHSATVCEDNDSAPPPLPVKHKRSDSYAPTSHTTRPKLPPRRVLECEQCCNLMEQLSLWELGMSGLTRQYSQILAQLNHARDAAMILECKMKENWEVGVKGEGVGVKGGGEREEKEKDIGGSLRAELKAARRRTMLDPVAESSNNSMTQSQNYLQIKTATLADQMYPQRDSTEGVRGGGGGGSSGDGEITGSFPAEYDQKLTELSTRLSRAIDLCQQLAVASFKTNSSNLLKKKRNEVGRKTSTPLSLTPDNPRKTPSSSLRPLVRVEEGGEVGKTRSKRGVLTRMETEPAMRTTNSRKIIEEEEGGEEIAKEKERRESEKEKEKKHDEKNKKKSKISLGKMGLSRSKSRYVPNKDKPPRLSMAGELFGGGEGEMQPVRSHMMSLIAAEETRERAGQVGGEAGPESPGVVVGSSGSDEGGELVMSHSSTFSDTDVKQVMTKIALLEDERLKLLETVDQMQSDNQRVRLSLQETVGDLENKDLQLTLAMQDLTIATDEIRKVAGLRSQLDTMEIERQETLEKLNNLEDESAAMKVSLIQLLQEKSATNKTLTLENWRLRQTVRQDSLPRTNSKSGAPNGEPALNYMKDDDLTNYVHKQGFLVKQGRRVKNWKRRLFVLDSTGLSYYRTEQPIQRVGLADITQIQVSRNHTALPHMFEVHTPGRTFLLSAPSADEMQSWVGMLQTLKQFARNPSPPAPLNSGDPALTTPSGVTVSPDAVLHQVLVENGSAAMEGGRGKEEQSTTLETKTGLTVRESEERGVTGAGNGESPSVARVMREREGQVEQRRPRSHAITLATEMSLDEAVPDGAARPHSIPGLEWRFVSQRSGAETIPEHPSLNESSITYNRVLSQSHPGTTSSIPGMALET